MSMLEIDGVALKDPSEMTWSLQDVSSSDTGRTEDGLMHNYVVAKKRKLQLVWWNLLQDEVPPILQAVNNTYMEVTYFDALAGETQTRTMYCGDRTAPVQWWCDDTNEGRIYGTVQFDLIER